jgi:hypothetical protein
MLAPGEKYALKVPTSLPKTMFINGKAYRKR